MGVGRFAPKPGTVTSTVSGPGAPGRPKKVGQPVYLPVAGASSFQPNPAVMQTAQEYIKKHQMPPGLLPTRSTVLQGMTNKKISQGFVPTMNKGPGNG